MSAQGRPGSSIGNRQFEPKFASQASPAFLRAPENHAPARRNYGRDQVLDGWLPNHKQVLAANA
jgi:hypothetical protein